MIKENKIWGTVTHVFQKDNVSVSHLEVQAGTHCSIHKHTDRVNQFTVISGEIEVHHFGWGKEPAARPRKIVALTPGMNHVVATDEWHTFIVIKTGIVVEVYWTQDGSPVRQDDIIRHTLGGVL